MSCWVEASSLLFLMTVSLIWRNTELYKYLTILHSRSCSAAGVEEQLVLPWLDQAQHCRNHPCGCILLAVQYARMFSLKNGPVECRIATNMALTFKFVVWEGPRGQTDIIVWTGIDFFMVFFFFLILLPFHPILYFSLLHWSVQSALSVGLTFNKYLLFSYFVRV